MTQPDMQSIKLFKGIKNDVDPKQIEHDYFSNANNFDYPQSGMIGIENILYPLKINQIGSSPIDGLFEFRYLDPNNVLQKQQIAVTNGSIYRDALSATPYLLKSGLIPGKVSFAAFNDYLFIANGKNYVQVYNPVLDTIKDMGAPFAQKTHEYTSAFVSGSSYFEITFVTAGGEEVLGGRSNTIYPDVYTKVLLTLPIGYPTTISRNIYRNGFQILTIADNTTTTITFDFFGAGTPIPPINNELPKPYFFSVANQKLYGTVVDAFPTQVFITDTNIEVWDAASGLDIANYGVDNTPVKGIGVDFNKIIIGTEKNIIMIDPATDTPIITRSNIGMKNGYSVAALSSFGDFPGGLMFVSSINDVRLMTGLQALPVATSFENVRTENWGQNIRGDLDKVLKSATEMYAISYNNRYILAINDTKYVFDIRTNGWTKQRISTNSNSRKSLPLIFGKFENLLYNGQPDGTIEQEFVDLQYYDEDVNCQLLSGFITVGTFYEFINKLKFWFLPSVYNNEIFIAVVTDSNVNYPEYYTVKLNRGAFDQNYFMKEFFDVDYYGMDYKVFNIQKPCRWFQYFMIVNTGHISYQGLEIEGQLLSNREG